MKKKVIGILLALMLITTMMPAAAFADEAMDAAENEASATDVAAGDEDTSDDQAATDPAPEAEAADAAEDAADPAQDALQEDDADDAAEDADAVLVAKGTDDTGESTTVIPANGGSGSGELDETTTTQNYTIKLTEAGRLTVTVVTDFKLKCTLTGGSANESSTVKKDSLPLTYDLTAGEYTLEFSRTLLLAESGSFKFTTSFESANETYTYENDSVNEVRSADAIKFGTAVNGQIALNDECDCFKVVLPSSGRLTANVHSNMDKVKIYLYDTNNKTVLSEKIDKGDQSYAFDLTAGTYYLMFDQYLSNTGTYNFKLTFAASGETYTAENDTINEVRNSSPVTLGSTVTGQIAENDDCDYYRIKISAKCKYQLKVNSDIDKYVRFCLYDSKEAKVADTSDSTIYDHGKGSKTYYYTLDAGTYYLKFEKRSSATGVYKFKLAPYLTKPAISNVSKAKKAFKVKWNKVEYANGYQVQYGLKKNMKGAKTVTVKKASAVSKKIKKLKSKKKYYVRVRAYKKVDGKTFYSAWSAKKSVKTK